MKDHEKIPCIVCSKELNNMVYKPHNRVKVEVHPTLGLHFRTHGHYGSQIFDPMGTGEYLDVAICDLCIMNNLDKVRGTGKKNLVKDADMLLDYIKRDDVDDTN